MLRQSKLKGFTVVELIVIIATAITLVSITVVTYGKIQKRATSVANKEIASQIKHKIEAWKTVHNSYPTETDVMSGLEIKDAKEIKIDSNVLQKITLSNSAGKNKPIRLNKCETNKTITGYKISWYDGKKDIALSSPSDLMIVGKC